MSAVKVAKHTQTTEDLAAVPFTSPGFALQTEEMKEKLVEQFLCKRLPSEHSLLRLND